MAASVDSADEKQVRELIAKAEERFGPLNGVIHAAAATRKEFFAPAESMDKNMCREHFLPKMSGLIVLENVLESKSLDFVVVMSSLSAVLGGWGFYAYAAANRFMDSFVERRDRRGRFPWVTVDWDGWQTGDGGPDDLTMTPEEGIEAFKRVLAGKKEGRLIHSLTDLHTRINRWVKRDTLGEEPGEEHLSDSFPREDLSSRYVAPRGGIEREIARIWEEMFGFRGIGALDDFFELGGDSLKVMTTVSKIHEALAVEIPIPEFFNRSTIEKLAQYIDASEKHEYSPIEPVEAKEYYPLSPTQQRLYLLQQLDKENVLYNMPVVVTLEGELQRETLEDTLVKLIARHESFRTFFTIVHGETVQAIRRDVEFRVEYFDAQKAEEDREIIPRFIRPFDLARAPLMRAALIKKGENTHILVVDTHHIISDGVSQALFSKEFMAFYGGKELPPLRIQYKDYSHWRNSRAGREESKKQEEYWLEQFKDGAPVTDLPTDFPRPDVQGFEGAVVETALSSDMTAALKTIAVEGETSVFNVLTALFTILVSRLTGRRDISVGTQTAGRRHTELQGIVGVFLNTLVLRNYPRPDRTFTDFLLETRTRIPGAFENQDYPFESLVEKVMGKRDINRNPMFDVMFVWQNFEAEEIRMPALTLKPYPHPLKNRALIDISIYGREEGDTFSFTFEYNTGLFKESTVRRFIEYFREIAAAVIADRNVRLKDITISHDLAMAKVDVLKESDDEFEF